MMIMILAKPADLGVSYLAAAGDRIFIAGYTVSESSPNDRAQWQLYVLENGVARVIVDALPIPTALIGDGAGGALCGTIEGLWSCTAAAGRRVDERPVSAMVLDERHVSWAAKGAILQMPLAGGAIEVLHRSADRIRTLAQHRGALYWIGAAGELPPPTILPGNFAILPLDEAPRALIVRPATGGPPTRTPLAKLPLTEVAVDDTGVFAVTRGGLPEQFDGHVLRVAHGGSSWDVLATGRKLPSQLRPIPGGVVWSYEISLGYVVEAFVHGPPSTARRPGRSPRAPESAAG